MKKTLFWIGVVVAIVVICVIVLFFAYSREITFDGYVGESDSPATVTIRVKWLRYVVFNDFRGTLTIEEENREPTEYEFSGKTIKADDVIQADVSAYDGTLNEYISISMLFDSKFESLNMTYKDITFTS